MRVPPSRPLARVLFLAALAACGGGDGGGPGGPTPPPPPPPPPPPGGTANFTATVNGQAWASAANLATVTAAASGTYIISGGVVQGTSSRAVTLTLMNIPGPGTYPLGTGAGVSGGGGIYAESSGGWGTSLTGEAGTITLTTLTAQRIAGTFSFTADAVSGGATGTRAVTNGSFDLPIANGTTTPVPPQNRMRISATVGGQPWNAATVVRIGTSQSFSFGGSNTRHSLNIAFLGLNGAGTYTLGDGVLASVQVAPPPGGSVSGPLCCWNGTGAGATATVTVTSFTAERIIGTFAFNLPVVSGGATAPLTAVNGTFDVAR